MEQILHYQELILKVAENQSSLLMQQNHFIAQQKHFIDLMLVRGQAALMPFPANNVQQQPSTPAITDKEAVSQSSEQAAPREEPPATPATPAPRAESVAPPALAASGDFRAATPETPRDPPKTPFKAPVSRRRILAPSPEVSDNDDISEIRADSPGSEYSMMSRLSSIDSLFSASTATRKCSKCNQKFQSPRILKSHESQCTKRSKRS